jgi:hypothetical protein
LKSGGETYDTTADNGEIKIQIHAGDILQDHLAGRTVTFTWTFVQQH